MGLSGVVLSTGQPINRPAVTGRPLSPDALLSLRRANTTLAGAARLRLARRRPGLLDHLAAGVGGDPILDRFLLAIRQGVARATISFPSVMWTWAPSPEPGPQSDRRICWRGGGIVWCL